jgi:hypothetical protein
MGGEPLDKTIRKLEKYVYNLSPVRSRNALTKPARETVDGLTKNVSLAKAQVEFSLGDEDEEARAQGFRLSIEQLEAVQEYLNQAGSLGLIDTIELVHLSSLASVCQDRIGLYLKQ